jgi:hypothetical protein
MFDVSSFKFVKFASPFRVLSVVLLASALIGLAWFGLRTPLPPNPVYAGKTLDKWLDDVIPLSGIYKLSPEAAEAVRQMGTNAVPYLLREAGTYDSRIKRFVQDMQYKISLGRFHSRIDDERQQAACRGLSALGTIALPGATQGLTNPDKRVRLGSAIALLSIGKTSPTIIQSLLGRLNDTDELVRTQAAIALASLGEDEPQIVVPALMELLNDKDNHVQQAAAYGLGYLGNKSIPAVPKLLKMLSETNGHSPDYIFAINAALGQIDPEAAAKAGIK